MSRTKINLSKQISIDANVAPDTSGLYTLGSASLKWGDLFLDDAAVVNFNGDVLMTHSSNTLTISGGTLATAALTSTTITASGIIKTDDTTEATSTTDGSLQTDGGLSVAKSVVVGDDLDLLSDSAILNFGADKDLSLTHGIVHTLASDIKDDHAASISQTSLTSSQSSISFVSLGSDIKSSIGLQLGNATFTSSTSAIEFIELGSDISSTHAGNIVGSFLGTSTSSINFGSESNAGSFNSALNSDRKVRFDDGTFVVDFTFGSYSGSGSSLTVSSAVGISDATVSSLSVSGLGGSGTMKPVAGSSTNAQAFNTSNPGVTIRIDVSGGASMEYALGSYSSGTSIPVSSATARSGSSIGIGSINDSGGSIKVVSASSSAASTFDSALASDRKMEFSDGTDKIIFTFSALGGGQSSLSISAQEQTAGSGAVSVAFLISGGHMKNVTASTNVLDIGPSAVTDLIRVGADDVVFKDGAYDVDVASHDGTNGLKLGGTLVTATAAELNYTDVTTLGTSQASKVVTADASGDITIVGAAANVVWDKSADALEFADNASAEFGTGLDMKVYHDGANSYITNAVGALKLATETSGIAVTIGHSTSEVTVADNLTVAGDLTVQGITTSIDTTHLLVEDSLIEIARGDGASGTRASNAGAGIAISGSLPSNDVTLTVATDGGRLRVSGSFTEGAGYDIATTGDYAIAGIQVLSADGAVKVQSGVAGTGLGHSAGALSVQVGSSKGLALTSDALEITSSAVTQKAITASSDSFMYFDADGVIKRETTANYADDIAGSGLSATAGVLAVDLSEIGAEAIDVANDTFLFVDATDDGTHSESIADLMTAVAGTGLKATAGVLSIEAGEQFYNFGQMNSSSAGETAVAAGRHATASVNLLTEVVSNSVEVYLNGLLQLLSGSSSLVGHPGDAYDYKIISTDPSTVQMRDALDSNDVLIVKYVKKN